MAAQTSRKAAAALALTLLAVAGCTRHAEQDSGGPQVDVLGSMLASESELNTIMGTTDLRSKTALRVPADLDADEHTARPECVTVIGNAMAWVYRDSGYRQFRETLFADAGANLEVDQAVAKFDNPAAARALMAHTLELWHQCAGDSLTITRGDRPPDVFLLAQPSVVDGVDVTHGEASDTPGYVSQRAIMVTDDLIVDIRITGHDVDAGKAVQLAKTIGGRNAL